MEEQNDDYRFIEACRMIDSGESISTAARLQGVHKGTLAAFYRGYKCVLDVPPLSPEASAVCAALSVGQSGVLPEASEEPPIPWGQIGALGVIVFFLTICVLWLTLGKF